MSSFLYFSRKIVVITSWFQLCSFIRSLSRSVAWKALGGKSGSSFTKSTDGRFVLKQMSRLELQSFMEFAPHYFAYMTQAIEEKVCTVIGSLF